MSEEIKKEIDLSGYNFNSIELNGVSYDTNGNVLEESKKELEKIFTEDSKKVTSSESVEAVDLNNIIYPVKDKTVAQSIADVKGLINDEASLREEEDLGLAQNIADLNTYLQTLQEQLSVIQNNIDNVKKLIPNQATEDNQLADKDFVNSSISSNTANFIGTFNTLEELEAQTATNNDYAFWKTTDSEGNVIFKRYKYVADDGTWQYEFDLNNSSFTAEQWATINSGLTQESIPTKTSDLENDSGFISESDIVTSVDGKKGDVTIVKDTSVSSDTAYSSTKSEAITKNLFNCRGKTINILGDSLTYGWDSSRSDNNYQMNDPYPKVLAQRLGCTVNNYGVGGSTLSTKKYPMCERVKNLPPADINILFGGGNDYLSYVPVGQIDSTDTSTICGALNVIADWYKKNASNSMVIFCGIPHGAHKGDSYTSNNGTTQIHTVGQINNYIKTIAEYNSFVYFDLENEIPNYNPSDDILANKWNKNHGGEIDKHHWNQAFVNEMLVPYFIGKLESLQSSKKDRGMRAIMFDQTMAESNVKLNFGAKPQTDFQTILINVFYIVPMTIVLSVNRRLLSVESTSNDKYCVRASNLNDNSLGQGGIEITYDKTGIYIHKSANLYYEIIPITDISDWTPTVYTNMTTKGDNAVPFDINITSVTNAITPTNNTLINRATTENITGKLVTIGGQVGISADTTINAGATKTFNFTLDGIHSQIITMPVTNVCFQTATLNTNGIQFSGFLLDNKKLYITLKNTTASAITISKSNYINWNTTYALS